MKLWRALAFSVAATAATCAATAPALADVVDRDTAANDDGLFAFLSNELRRSSELVQRFFFDASGDTAPQTVQLIVLEEDSTDDNGGDFGAASALLQQELTRDEQQLACQTALQIFHERDALAHERTQLSQRLRAPFKRAFQAMSLHYFDEASCDDLDDARLVAACNRFVDMEAAVRAFMTRDRSDEQVCELATASPTVNGELSCKLCKRFVQMIDDALVQEVAQVQVVREIIGDICDSMSPDSMCHTFLKQYDQIVEWLRQGTSPDLVCARITMCPAQTPSLAAVTPADVTSYAAVDVTGHACSYCARITYIVAKVNAVSPDHLNFARKLIAWGCKISPKDCKCDVLVENYDRIVAWIKQDKSPREICESLKLCTNDVAAPAIASLPAAFAGLMPLVHVADPHAALSLQDERMCFYCDYATTLVQIALQEQTDLVNEVRLYADLICQLLGPGSGCHAYVDKLDAVIDALAQGKRPRDICAAMKYCGTKPMEATVATNALFIPTVQDGKMCLYCNYGGLVLKIILEQDAAQVDELRQAADMVCGFLGPDHVCHAYVDKFDKLIDALKQGQHPRAICVALKYCAATTTAQALATRVEHALSAFNVESRAVDVRDNKKCFYCEYIAMLLQIVRQEDAAQVDELREYADLICGILGPDNICHQYIDKLDAVIDGLQKGKHPHEICMNLKYCATTAAMTTMSMSKTALPVPVAAATTIDLAAFDQQVVKTVKSAFERAVDSCFVCTQLASILAVAVQEDPAQIDQIRQIGDLVCGFLPSESKCRPVMNELDTVIDALKKGETPKAICHNLKFCKAAAAAAYAQPLTVAARAQPTVAMNVSCAYCSGVVTVLEVALQQKPNEVQEARQAAGIVCDLLPSGDQCHEDLKLFDAAVMQLRGGKQSHQICTSLKFCASHADALAVTVADLAVVDPSLAPSRCTVCKQNSLLLASLLASSSPSRLAAFNHEMNSVCRLVPDTKECKLLLKHRETIVDALERNEDIDAICTRLHECGASSSSTATTSETTPAISMSCLLCEYTAEMVKFASKDQNELRLAKVALETMCVILPPTARCDVLSSKFDDLVALAQSGKSPNAACRAIALCGGATAAASIVGEPAVRADYLLPAQFAPIAAVGDVLEVE